VEFVWTAAGIVNAATGVLFALLGLLVAALGRGRRLNLAFAAFAGAWGLSLTYVNLLVGWPKWLVQVDALLNVVSALGLLLVGVWFAPRTTRTPPRAYVVAGAIGLLSVLPYWLVVSSCLAGGPLSGRWAPNVPCNPTIPGWAVGETLVWPLVRAVWWFTLALLALRFHNAQGPRQRPERRTYALVTLALLWWPSAWTALALGFEIVGWHAGVGAFLGLLAVLGLWIRNTVGTDPWASRWARNLVLVGAATTLASYLANRIWTFPPPSYGPEFGLARVLGLGLLAYLILKHHLFGIELQAKRFLRWATTVAAALVLASAVVALGLALGSGNPYAAAAAAGALAVLLVVLLREPLTSLGDRVAHRAMPRVAASPAYYAHRKLEVYGAALSEVRSTGSPTSAEDAFLARLRRQMGITPDEDRLLRTLALGHEAETPSGPLVAGRLEPYVRALRRELAAHPETAAASTNLRALRADLGVTEREHALLEFALRHAASPHDAERHLSPGQTFLGRYTVTRTLGSGGFARTYLCRDEQAGRDVVLKVLRPGAPEGAEAVLREARAVAAIQHAHVVTLYDVELLGEDAFIAMEHLAGGSLKDRVGAGPLQREAFLRLARDLLSALAAVHDAGIVHGDVKPSNVLFAGDGGAKLADFGIAQLPGFESTLGEAEGTPAGTVRYMSPEVAKGRRATVRSDLFSAASTLYEAFTGRPYVEPRPEESAFETQMRVANLGAFPGRFAGPPWLAEWFRVALDPAPERRFPNAAAMRKAFDRRARAQTQPAARVAASDRPSAA